MSGIQFVVDAKGDRTAVVIDLKKFGDVWEDFYDTLIAQRRVKERCESLASVKKRLQAAGANSMADYAVTFARSARRELESLEMPVVAKSIYPH